MGAKNPRSSEPQMCSGQEGPGAASERTHRLWLRLTPSRNPRLCSGGFPGQGRAGNGPGHSNDGRENSEGTGRHSGHTAQRALPQILVTIPGPGSSTPCPVHPTDGEQSHQPSSTKTTTTELQNTTAWDSQSCPSEGQTGRIPAGQGGAEVTSSPDVQSYP